MVWNSKMSLADKMKASANDEDLTLILRGDYLTAELIIKGSVKDDPGVHITGVQRMRHGEWHITVKDTASYDRLRVKSLIVKGKELTFEEKTVRPTIVSVLYYPVAGNTALLIKTMESYGDILGVKEMVYKQAPTIKTGTRLFKMRIKEHIPKFLLVKGDGSDVEVIYTGQPESCRICRKIGHPTDRCALAKCSKCLKTGHLAKKCTNDIKCRNCGNEGHVSKDCQEKCGNCGLGDHKTNSCQTKATWKTKPAAIKEANEAAEKMAEQEPLASESELDSESDSENEEDLFKPLVMDVPLSDKDVTHVLDTLPAKRPLDRTPVKDTTRDIKKNRVEKKALKRADKNNCKSQNL